MKHRASVRAMELFIAHACDTPEDYPTFSQLLKLMYERVWRALDIPDRFEWQIDDEAEEWQAHHVNNYDEKAKLLLSKTNQYVGDFLDKKCKSGKGSKNRKPKMAHNILRQHLVDFCMRSSAYHRSVAKSGEEYHCQFGRDADRLWDPVRRGHRRLLSFSGQNSSAQSGDERRRLVPHRPHS